MMPKGYIARLKEDKEGFYKLASKSYYTKVSCLHETFWLGGLCMVKRGKIKIRTILFILFAIYVVYTIGAQQIKLWDLAKQEASLTKRLENSKGEMTDLKKKVELLHTENYLEKVARDELGLIKSNELIYKKQED